MSSLPAAFDDGNRRTMTATIRRIFRDRPIIPLLVLLAVLIGSLQLVQPGMLTSAWASSTIRFAVPLAILAACQTMTMLTGGIDLSVATVASMSSTFQLRAVAWLVPAYCER